jgi:CheY-like chemotaxis protein
MKEPVILLVENEENDVFFFRRALSALNYQGHVRVVESVSQARAYLSGVGEFRNRSYYPSPDLIVSDFKLHGETGLEFFRWLKAHPGYAEIPFVLFTGSATREEGEAAMRTGARAFFTKCADFHDMKKCVEDMLEHLPPPGFEGSEL